MDQEDQINPLLHRARKARVTALRDTGCLEGFYAPPDCTGRIPPLTRDVVVRLMGGKSTGSRDGSPW